MSLATPQLQTRAVLEPRLNIDSIRRYNILRGGKNISFKPIRSTSYSSSSAQFTAPPPNPAIIVDRELYVLMSARLTFSGVRVAGQKLLNIGTTDALRAYPISNAMINTLQATINNTSVAINMSDVIEPLLRYNVPEFKRGKIFSMTPSMQDKFQEYALWQGAGTTIASPYTTVGAGNRLGGDARHPLSGYGAISGDEMARGGFQSLCVISDASGDGTVGDAVVDVLLCEPIFLSPLLFGGEGAGFIGVQTMDFNFTFNSELGRMWSRYDTFPDNAVPTNVALNYITNIQVALPSVQTSNVFGVSPTLLFNYITPGELMPIHREYVYPYFNIDRYPTPSQAIAGLNMTDLSTYNTSLTTTGTTIVSNNIQLQSIPRRIYVVCREDNRSRLAKNATSTFPALNGSTLADAAYSGPWNHSDSYAVIQNITLNWNNNAGLLSSASQQDLYRMSVNNGCQMSWNEWSNTIGSVVALDFGRDIQLGDLEAPGKLMTSQLQLDVRVQNLSQFKKNYTLYIIVVSEGTFTIVDNRCITQIGVVSENDIFEASKSKDFEQYHHVENIYGGDFFAGLKKIVREAAPILKNVAIETLPILANSAGHAMRGAMGGELEGAGISGGKAISKEKLRARLNR